MAYSKPTEEELIELLGEDITLTQDEIELIEGKESYWRYPMETIIGIIIFLLILVFFAPYYAVKVPAGYTGVLYSPLFGGTQVNGRQFDEGYHLIIPIDKVEMYETRVQEHQDTITALTEDGLDVSVEVSFRYFPDYEQIGLLHRELGPNYLDRILVPHISAITRDVISYYRVDKLYYSSSRDSIQINMTNRAQRQITDNYPINLIDIVVRNIELPKLMAGAITDKLIQEQKMLAYDFKLDLERKEALRRQIEAQGIRMFRDTSQIDILKWEGINATKELATSPNSKVVVVGTNSDNLPIILGGN